MPYNLKHRETGELAVNGARNSQVREWDTIKDAANWLLSHGDPAQVFEWEAVEAPKPLPTTVGLYVSDADGNRDEVPVNLYALNWARQWTVLGPEGWERRVPSTLPSDLVRLVPEQG